MNRTRARKALDLFREATDLPEADRAAFMECSCGSDVDLRAEVESLLASDAGGWSALDQSVHRNDFSGLLPCAEQPLSKGFLAAERFTIVERLNEGGMGIVYRAIQDNPRREVALKVMRSGSADLIRRFEREIDILARLRHPGIGQIFDAGRLQQSSGSRPYLAMELVHGESIVAFANSHRLDVPARLEMFAMVCDAVQYAHQSGVIHRDLKPDNILVEESAGGYQPRVLDFGVGALTSPSNGTLATMPGALVGTIAYMAPEQASGLANTQSDVYSLGVILYELLCGALPIDVRSDPLLKAAKRIHDEAPVPISLRDSRLRGDLETIINKALEKEPVRRYATADALASDIRRLLRHEPILARPASVAYVLQRFSQRHRWIVSVTAFAVFAIFGALAVTSVALVRARSAERQALSLARVMAQRALPMLTDQAGTKSEREALANDVHATAKSLLVQSPNDPIVLSVYADAVRQLSRLKLDAGHIDRTLQLCRNAYDARMRAIELTGHEEPHLQSALSIDMVLIGDALKLQRRLDEACTWYKRAEASHVLLVERDPSVDNLEHLAWSEHRLGSLALEAGNLSEAAERFERFMSLGQRMLSMRPGDLTALDTMREAYVSRASIQRRKNELSEAIESLETALAMGRRLIEEDPRNRIYLRGHVSNLIAAFSFFTGEAGKSRRRELAATALPIAEAYYKSDPTDLTATCKLAAMLGHCAEITTDNGDIGRATDHIDQALTLYDTVSSRWTIEDAHDAHSTYARAADLFARIGRLDEAKSAHLRAMELSALEHDTVLNPRNRTDN